MTKKIDKLNFPIDFKINNNLVILDCLGKGWEGEVYRVKEKSTGIVRAAKFFYPKRNISNKAARFYAKKLHKLRGCPILINYLMQDQLDYQGAKITFLISDYIDGIPLSQFLKTLKGKRMGPFQALHLLYAIVVGLEKIHAKFEYHGDLHSDNVIIQRSGLSFDLKLIDLYQWGRPSKINLQDDIVDAIKIFYEALGGAKNYNQMPEAIKSICCGLKRSLILKKFKSLSQLRRHLETFQW